MPLFVASTANALAGAGAWMDTSVLREPIPTVLIKTVSSLRDL